MKDSAKLADKFIGYGIKSHRIYLDDKDPSELGFKKFWKLVSESNELKFSDVIRDRLYG